MRNAIAAVLSARSALPQTPTPPNQADITTTSSKETPTLPVTTTYSASLATTSLEVAVGTTTELDKAISTISSLATVIYTPSIVTVTASAPAPVTTAVSITLGTLYGGPGGSAINTTFAAASFTYTPTVILFTAAALSPTSPTSQVSSNTSATNTSTATRSQSPAISTSPNNSNGNLSSPTVAGIAVGCAILGALIAIGVFFFFMGDRLRKRHRSGATSSQQAWSGHSKQSGFPSGSLRQRPNDGDKGRAAEEVSVETVLEQPKDDASVKQTVAALFKAIDDHVENYYVDTASRSGRSAKEPTTQSSRLPTGIALQSDVDFDSLLSDRLFRSSAITSLITAQVLDAIDFFGVTERSLLPEIVPNFLRSSAGQVQDNQRSRLHLSRWRTSTASLLGPADSPQRAAHSQRAIDALIADVDAIVGAYVRPETDKDRRQHLIKLCKRAQELGLMLLSQPAEWRFHWSDGANAQRTGPQSHRSEKSKKAAFVAQPQLRRVTDNVARKLDRPLIVLDWQVLQ